jgi:hypothetical protein
MGAPGEPPARGIFTAARTQLLRPPVLWGVVFGAIQAASPLGFWWLDPATVYALSLTLIAAVYIGFAVADGRPAVMAVESGIAGVFVVVAAAGVTGPAWLLVLGLTGHGFVVGGPAGRWLDARRMVRMGWVGGRHALVRGAPPPGLVTPECRGEGSADQDPGRCGHGHRDPERPGGGHEGTAAGWLQGAQQEAVEAVE